MKDAALYIRVSTDKQDELSPDAQKRLLTEYAAKNKIRVLPQYIFMENGVSGKKADKRPQFQKMIALAKSKNHPIDAILVWKFSRFARNQEESIVYKSLLKRNHVEVVSVSEPIIEGPFGTLIERIIEWMDEYYSIRLSGEVIRGMTENALRGRYQASPPLGYRIDQRGKPPVIVAEEAEIVRLIFDKYVTEAMSYFEIARLLNSLGFHTKNGGMFERRSIEYIIQNPMYKGYLRWNRTHSETNTIKEESEWIIRKGAHEPIISEEVFSQAQEKSSKEHIPKKARPITEYKHFLSGMVKCSNCNKTLSPSLRKNGKISYFQCTGYSKGKCSVSHSISERNLVPSIITALSEVIVPGTVNFKIIPDTMLLSNLTITQKQLETLGIREQRIKIAYINGIDTLDEYKMNKELLEEERRELIKKLKELEQKEETAPEEEIAGKITNVQSLLNSDTDILIKNKAVKNIVEKMIYVKSERTVDIYYYYS